MFSQQVKVINNFFMLLDAVCILIAGYLSYLLRKFLSTGSWNIGVEQFLLSILVVIIVNNFVMGKVGLYSDEKISNYIHIPFAVFKAIVIDFIILGAVIFLLKKVHYSRAFFVYFAILSYILIVVERSLVQFYFHKLAHKRLHARNLVVVGDEKRGKLVSDALEKQLSWGHKILEHLSADEIKYLPNILIKYPVDEVVFALGGDKSINLSHYLDLCRKMGVEARILPALWSPENTAFHVETIQGIPFLTIGVTKINVTGLLYKKILDITVGTIGTFLFFLMYPFVAIAIKLDSPGPVLFKQKRVGQHGRVFTLYKFRTMYVDAEERKKELMAKNMMKGFMFKIENDPRITRVGRFLRKTSLDEFPQFLNVLKGEMSIVGTRPPTLDEVEKYEPWHWKRLTFKPGITGLWQISGRNKINDFNKVVELDCEYVENWRFIDDIKIILKTIWVIFGHRNGL